MAIAQAEHQASGLQLALVPPWQVAWEPPEALQPLPLAVGPELAGLKQPLLGQQPVCPGLHQRQKWLKLQPEQPQPSKQMPTWLLRLQLRRPSSQQRKLMQV